MSMHRSRLLAYARFPLALAAAAATALAAPRAFAQDDAPAPPPPPPPSSARAPNGEYVAPLQQQTQTTYVPQSVALSGPPIIHHYQPGAPIPQGYHLGTRMRRGLIVGGAVTFGVTYAVSSLAGAAITDANRGSAEEGGEFLYVPVLGPFLQMTRTDSATGNWTLATLGLAQAAGATMLAFGLTAPKTVLIRNDVAEVRLAPVSVGQRGTGLGLVGSF